VVEHSPPHSRPLRIGVDGRELVGSPTGVGHHLKGLLAAWSADPRFRHHVTLIAPAPAPQWVGGLGERFSWRLESADRAGTWWEQTRLRRAAERSGVDVFFAPGYTAPLALFCPSVVVIHDVSFFAHPEWFGWRQGLRRRWLTRASSRRASGIITVSDFSAREIMHWLKVPRDRIHLAPSGSPAVTPPTTLPTRERVVLFVGSLFNRRRIPELLRGFAIVASRVPDARLVLVGDNRTFPPIDPMRIASELGVGDRVTWRGHVSDDELERLYWTAGVFAFLSDYEGFGITPLEALAHGLPPVLLDTPAAREIYGESSVRVSSDPGAIADALTTLLTDERAHARALAAGRARLPMYSWAVSAAVVRDVLEQAASGR
jgi:glycosyltransferase involved in cell wall biosynthesis